MIARSNHSQERIFPAISPDIYHKLGSDGSELTADRQAACNLLALANQKFSVWQMRIGKLDVRRQFGRLLFEHRQAIEAELACQWRRADFFWLALQIKLKALSKQQQIWLELAQTVANPEVKVMNEPDSMRQRFVDELLIDTHCAFYNGLIQHEAKPLSRDALGLNWVQRAFVHIDYIQQLLEFSPKQDLDVLSLLGEAWQTRITASQEAEKWQQAIDYCLLRLRYLPNVIDFQSELAEVHYLGTLAKLLPALTKIQHSQNTKTLLAGTCELEKCLKNYPYNLTIFQLLGNLYHLRAINSFTSHQLAESLVLIQKAIAYNPNLKEAIQTRFELVQKMNELQELSRQLELEMKPGVLLNQEGQHMFVEANKGFALMNAYIDSDAAKETAKAFHVAEAVNLWHNIRLPEPSEGWLKSPDSWIFQALQLWEGVNGVLQNPPDSQAEIKAVWEAVIVNQPELAGLNSKLICTFLENTLFEEIGDDSLDPLKEATGEPPILTPVCVKL